MTDLPNSVTPPSMFSFLPVAFAASQEPKTASDTPTTGGAPTGAGTQMPGGPGGAPAAPTGGLPCAADNSMLLYMGLFLALMYFMVMRPEQKKRKEQQAMMAAIKQGDRVVTSGGMHGIVSSLTERTVTLRVDTVKMTFDRMAVVRIDRDEASGEAPKA